MPCSGRPANRAGTPSIPAPQPHQGALRPRRNYVQPRYTAAVVTQHLPRCPSRRHPHAPGQKPPSTCESSARTSKYDRRLGCGWRHPDLQSFEVHTVFIKVLVLQRVLPPVSTISTMREHTTISPCQGARRTLFPCASGDVGLRCGQIPSHAYRSRIPSRPQRTSQARPKPPRPGSAATVLSTGIRFPRPPPRNASVREAASPPSARRAAVQPNQVSTPLPQSSKPQKRASPPRVLSPCRPKQHAAHTSHTEAFAIQPAPRLDRHPPLSGRSPPRLGPSAVVIGCVLVPSAPCRPRWL